MRHLSFEVRSGIKIPLRDGVRLGGRLYKPKHLNLPSPFVVALTPYGTDSAHDLGVSFAKRGLPFLIVDCRGRGDSEGEFRPLTQEGRDGFDVVEWLAGQAFCDGKVGMYGSSYSGYVQWATAKEAPPHLATIVPAAAVGPGIDFPMRNNIFHPYVVQWLMLTKERALPLQLFRDSQIWSDINAAWHRSGRPFRELDEFAGAALETFQRWLDHPTPGADWDRLRLNASENARLGFPILTVTGSYDDDQPGALGFYRAHLRSAPEAVSAMHYLVIGPWDHKRVAKPCKEFGGIEIGHESVVDMVRLHWEWYAWTMQGGERPELLKKRVAYYVMGAECWRYADSLEAVTERHVPHFLASNGRADDVLQSGLLELQPGFGPPDTYRYDPRECHGPEVEAEMRASGDSLVDQTLTSVLRGRQFVYHSAPFEADTDICGFFKLSVWLSIDCPDTDFYVSVHEIALDGTSLRLSTDAVRARYRAGLRTPKLIQTEEPLRYEFEQFTFVARQIPRGHRLRLIIAPLGRIIEGTFVQKNYNGGGVVAEESQRDGRPVTVRLFHDESHPSALFVPIGHGGSFAAQSLSGNMEEVAS